MSRWSIARRLGALIGLVLGALWLLAVAATTFNMRYETGELFDGALQEAAERLLPLAEAHLTLLRDGAVGVEEIGDPADEEYLLYQVLDASGRLLLRSHQAPAQAFVLPPQAGFADSGPFRIYTALSDSGLAIEVADRQEHRDEALYGSLLWLLAPLLALLPLAALALWWTLRQATRPILALQAQLGERHGGNLTPLPEAGLPDELAPVAQDVNLLLARLERALAGERAFAANSAHELRTPIAAALAQAQLLAGQLASGQQAARAASLVVSLQRLARLVEKLLQLARAESGAALAREPFDALPVLRLLLDEAKRRPEVADRLRFEAGGPAALWLDGDIDAWGIAVQNLLDNALAHGTGEVLVRLLPGGALSIANGGPVVPPELMARLTARFTRGQARGPGSGLGLAIVEAIAQQSGGSLTLHSPARGSDEGFEAILALPLASAPTQGAGPLRV